MAKYTKNKKGYYRATFSIINSQGKKQRIEVYEKSVQALERKLLEKKIEYEKGLLVTNGKSTVEKWALEWLNVYKKGKVGEGTYTDYKQKLSKYILPAIGQQHIEDIKHHHLQAILNEQHLSKSTAKKVKNSIEQIFKTAEVNGLIVKNPAAGLELPKLEDGKRRSITKEERALILKISEYHRAGLWIKIMLYCGLRPSEAIVLNWEDVDFENKLIKISKALELKTGKIKSPKTQSGIRNVPIPDVLYASLSSLRAEGPIFTQPTTGKPHTSTSMRCMWESFVREMNIEMGAKVFRNQIKKEDEKVAPDLTPYCLRHTYCTDLQNAGVPINVAKYLMGHSDISVTANIYTHHSEEASKSALDYINSYQAKI